MSDELGQPNVDAKITWIHLSDFHAGQRGKTSWFQAELELEKSVREQLKHLGAPDFVLFTGDLANRGTSEDYELVDRLLDRIDTWVGHELPVFAVPGNHDVVRPNEDDAYQYAAFKRYDEHPELGRRLWERQGSVPELERLFGPYTKWAEGRMHASLDRAGWRSHRSSRVPGDSSVVVEKDGLRLGLVGLNTAWAHLDDIEGGLPLPAEQLHSALPPSASGNPLDWFRSVHVRLLLTHHPRGWLSPKALATYEAEVHPPDRFTVALFGHMHTAQAEVVARSGTAARAFYQSPSLFGLEHYGTAKESRVLGYTWGRITGTGEVRVWPQKFVARHGGHFEFDRDQGFGVTNDGLGGTILVAGRSTVEATPAPRPLQPTDTRRGEPPAVAISPSLGGGSRAKVDRWAATDVLASVATDANLARLVATRAGFPAHMLPSFSNALVFWSTVVEAADNGVLEGIAPLLEAAATIFPNHAELTKLLG